MKKKYNSLEEREKQKSRDEEIKRFLEEHPELTLMEVGKKYDLTPDEYNIILDKQGFVCAICGMEEISLGVDGKPRPLSVDHDHKTGIVRELLCQECNFKIGKIEMAAETESRMIEYLIRHRSDKLGKTLLSILPSILDRFSVT